MGIRNFFKKKDDTVIDLGNLQKRGIIKPEEKTFDLTNTPDSTIDSSPLGFLGNLANASSSEEQEPALLTERKQKLRGILRDLKGKIDSTYDKVYKLSERFDLIERKIERLERRSSI